MKKIVIISVFILGIAVAVILPSQRGIKKQKSDPRNGTTVGVQSGYESTGFGSVFIGSRDSMSGPSQKSTNVRFDTSRLPPSFLGSQSAGGWKDTREVGYCFYMGRGAGWYCIHGSYNIVVSDSLRVLWEPASYVFLVDYDCSLFKKHPLIKAYLWKVENVFHAKPWLKYDADFRKKVSSRLIYLLTKHKLKT